MTYCELCELPRDQCQHGLAERQSAARLLQEDRIVISRAGIAHFAQCPHKGDDPNYEGWATLDTPGAWQRLGNGEQLVATGGSRLDRVATSRCRTCENYGPW